jgi:hypothetical protein
MRIRRIQRLRRRRDRRTRENEDDCRNLLQSACDTRQRLSVAAVAIRSLCMKRRARARIQIGNDAEFLGGFGLSHPRPSSTLAAAVAVNAV